MLKKTVLFVAVAAAVAILAFQRQREDRLPFVRDASDEPVAPPTPDELKKATRLDYAWRP